MKSILSIYKFKLAGWIQLDKDRLVFKSEHELSTEPVIYCWALSENIDDSSSTVSVIYVGKASFGLTKRMTQHIGGFSHSTTGSKNKDYLARKFDEKYEVSVYARKPAKYQVFGRAMNGCSIEEEFFIDLIKNNRTHSDNGILNRKRYPKN